MLRIVPHNTARTDVAAAVDNTWCEDPRSEFPITSEFPTEIPTHTCDTSIIRAKERERERERKIYI